MLIQVWKGFFAISDLFFYIKCKSVIILWNSLLVAFQDNNSCDELVSIIAKPFGVIGKFTPDTERSRSARKISLGLLSSVSKIIFLGPAGVSLARSSSAGASISHTLKIRWRRPRPHASPPPPNLVPKFSLSLRKTNNRNGNYPWHIKFRPATWPWNSDIGQQKCKLATTTWWWVKNVTATRKIAKY